MNDAFKQMGHSILQTFGRPLSITFADHSTIEIQGVIRREIVELGEYDAVSGEITVLTVDSSVKLKRGNSFLSDGVVYEVDKKIKDDGLLAKWNIYVYRA